MTRGIVVIRETAELEVGLTKFTVTWPNGKVLTKYVDMGDDVNERRRQEQFIENRGYTVKWNMEGTIRGD